jgi:hypothetical protein
MKQTLVRVMRISLVYAFALGAATTVLSTVNTADLKGSLQTRREPIGDAKVGWRASRPVEFERQLPTSRVTIIPGFASLHYKISVEATTSAAVAQDVELAIGQQAQCPSD